MELPRRILCPIDFEASSNRAVGVAVDLAKVLGASLTIVHVYDAPVYAYSGAPFMPIVDTAPAIERAAQQMLDRVAAETKPRLPDVKAVLRRGRAWEEILGTAKELGADLIVMGTHGRKGLPHVLLGSVAEKVVRLSPVPVLTVRAAEPAPAS